MGKRIMKSWVMLILLISILTGQSSVQAQEEHSESILSDVLQDDKSKQFLKDNEALLKSLKEEKEVLLYSLEAYPEYPFWIESINGDPSGIFPQMIQLFEQLTQVTFQQVSDAGTKDEMMAKLKTGDLHMAFGLTMSNQTKENLTSSYKECKIVGFHEKLFYDSFVLIGQVQEEEYTQQMLPAYYWGCLEDQYVELAQTELMNHTVTYNSIKDLEAAYQEGTIQGMFITQGLEAYYTFLDRLEYANIKEVTLEASKYYGTAKNDRVLNQLLPKMIQLYLSLYDDYYFNEIPILEASHKELDIWVIRYLPVLVMGVFVITLLFGIVLVIKRQEEKKKMLRILKQIPNKARKEQEVLYVFLEKSRIKSKQYFRVFGLEQKHPRKTMAMQELTKRIGFDFKKHYAFLRKNKEREFTFCFDLYIGGIVYHFEEIGICEEEVIVSKIYRKEKLD